MKKRALTAGLLALILAAPTAQAKAPIAITNLAPTLTINFTGGDQISAMAQGAGAIYLAGTVESANSPLLTSQSLGSSDGFLVALSPNGSHVWDLRLGSSGDDVATSIYVDLIGNIWVAGASAVSASNPAPGLNRLTVSEVNSAGQLINTYIRDVPEADVPISIAAKGANFLLQGINLAVVQGANNISFAIPYNKIKKVLKEQREGKVEKAPSVVNVIRIPVQ